MAGFYGGKKPADLREIFGEAKTRKIAVGIPSILNPPSGISVPLTGKAEINVPAKSQHAPERRNEDHLERGDCLNAQGYPTCADCLR